MSMQWNKYTVYPLYVVGRAVCKGFDVLACCCCSTLHCAVCHVIVYNERTRLNTNICFYVMFMCIPNQLLIRYV